MYEKWCTSCTRCTDDCKLLIVNCLFSCTQAIARVHKGAQHLLVVFRPSLLGFAIVVVLVPSLLVELGLVFRVENSVGTVVPDIIHVVEDGIVLEQLLIELDLALDLAHLDGGKCEVRYGSAHEAR